MLKNERQAALLDLCVENGSVSVRQVVSALGVSEMTVRRDFDELAGTGKVARVHGGIRSISHASAPTQSAPIPISSPCTCRKKAPLDRPPHTLSKNTTPSL